MSDGSCPAAISSAPVDGAGEDRSRQPLLRLIGEPAERTPDRFTTSDLVAWFQDRATLALMMIFGSLNILPNPPGTSLILGLPMLYLSLARLLDRQPWFPRIVMDWRIAAAAWRRWLGVGRRPRASRIAKRPCGCDRKPADAYLGRA